jgi:ribosomal protein S18 acetylase RimI-like enzyme
MKIVDLREVHPRALEGLFDEQALFWRDVFLWDYRPALDMVRRFVGTRSLEGFAVMEGDDAVAYSFYVLEDRKGLIGDFFISSRFSPHDVACPLLTRILAPLQSLPWINRVETHIMPLETEMLRFLTKRNFSLHERQFMRLHLAPEIATTAPTATHDARTSTGENRGAPAAANRDAPVALDPPDEARFAPLANSGAFAIERWGDRWNYRDADGVARLIQLAYATHVDSQINDQYSSEAGAHRFLRNITQTLACGEFLRDASFVLRPHGEPQPAGVILASKVDDGVAHITQICVMPGYQRNGIGRMLMDASIGALRARRYHDLTLTVTSANRTAAGLYESLGFRTLRKFCAGVWRA